MRNRIIAALLACAALAAEAAAQDAITQEGTVLQNAPMMFRGNNRARQGVPVGGGPTGQIVTTGDSVGGGRCDYSAPSDAKDGYYWVCFDASQGKIIAGGTKPPRGLKFEIDGVVYEIPIQASFIGTDVAVANIMALKARAGQIGQRALRLGFRYPGDGGMATYNWQAAACTTPDDGAQVPAAVSGCWVADFSGTQPTPMIWGAHGDGIANDLSAVQAAVNALQGGTLYVGERIYKLTSAGITSIGQITIQGDGGGQGIYNSKCARGFRAGSSNMDLFTLPAAGSAILHTCIDSLGTTNTSGAAISIPQGSDRTIVADTQINGACVSLDITSEPVNNTQLVNPVARGNTIVPAQNPACRAIWIGRKSTGSNTVGAVLRDNQIYCGADTGGQTGYAIGIEINDSGGIHARGDPPYGCSFGTIIRPGANQGVVWSFFDEFGAGDSSGYNDLLINPTASSAIIFGTEFNGSWASYARTGPSVLIKNDGNTTSLAGTRFRNHRSYVRGSNSGFYVESGKGFVLDNSVVCTTTTNSSTAIAITGNAQDNAIRNNTIGSCDALQGTFSAGISLSTSSTSVGIVTGNQLSQFPTIANRIVWAVPGIANAIIENNYGVDNEDPAPVASAPSITISVNRKVYITGGNPIHTMLPAWNGAQKHIVAMSPGGFTMNIGGNFCNSIAATQFSPVLATFSSGLNCWLLR
jgi:hypothetical protein